jgi:hypothetical protein
LYRQALPFIGLAWATGGICPGLSLQEEACLSSQTLSKFICSQSVWEVPFTAGYSCYHVPQCACVRKQVLRVTQYITVLLVSYEIIMYSLTNKLTFFSRVNAMLNVKFIKKNKAKGPSKMTAINMHSNSDNLRTFLFNVI